MHVLNSYYNIQKLKLINKKLNGVITPIRIAYGQWSSTPPPQYIQREELICLRGTKLSHV